MSVVKAKLTLFFLYFLSFFPLKAINLLGSMAGYVLSITPNSLRSVTKINLTICFPSKTEKEIHILTRKSLKESSKSFFESGKCWVTYPRIPINQIIEVEGKSLVLNSLKEGNGVILFTPHMGNIEILLRYLAENFNCTVPYTPSKMASLDIFVRRARELMGANMVTASSSGVKTLFSSLKKKGLIIIASDQVPKRENGLIANFFGTQALSVSLISSLAIRTKSACHSVFCIRLKKGKGFKIIFNKKISDMNVLSTQEGVNLMNKELEECIMMAPEQYAWEYKRFKHSVFKNPY